jgi:hypothetical protein
MRKKSDKKTYMATDNFLFIPPDNVETIAFRFDVKPTSNNILNQIKYFNYRKKVFLQLIFIITFQSFFSFLYFVLVLISKKIIDVLQLLIFQIKHSINKKLKYLFEIKSTKITC